ncbi:hypothetical protein [Serratia ureilytica]|uniref:hypothetical protein n=1 Tax=Serratia ureilytica TaxID=300181 RepID=UPI001D1814DD|nr:hypothetical protein [Serratia ureilytica]MCC4104761.1 hypothetical protein [Serratia ureilytica]
MKEDAIQLDLLEDETDLDNVSFEAAVVIFSKFIRILSGDFHKNNIFDVDFKNGRMRRLTIHCAVNRGIVRAMSFLARELRLGGCMMLR